MGTGTYLVTDIYGNSRQFTSLGGVAEVQVTGVPQFLRNSAEDIAVSKPVLALRSAGVVMPGVPSRVSSRIFNPLRDPLTGKLTLTAPAGTRLEPVEYAVTVKPGEQRDFESTLLVPVGSELREKQLARGWRPTAWVSSSGRWPSTCDS